MAKFANRLWAVLQSHAYNGLSQTLCEIGLVAMEGIDAKHYPAVRELGLKIRLLAEDMALEMVRVILRIQKQLSMA